MLGKYRWIAGLAVLGCLSFAKSAQAFDLTNCGTAIVPVPCPYVTYGDGNSYSLPVNALLHSFAVAASGGSIGTGPGNPYYVVSTPGAIKDLTVIGTGASGGPVNNNYTGADDAYPTPNSDGIVYFSTGTTADPGNAGEFTGDAGGTWDVTLGALRSFMGSENQLIFFFNNNQTNSGASTNQNLAAWAQLTVRDAAGTVIGAYDFTNQGSPFAGPQDGGGGTLFGNPGAYSHVGPLDSPLAGTNLATDYVLSGGELCYSGNSLATFSGLLSCSNPAATNSIDSNLGANQAAYAVVFPELDLQLQTLFAGNVDGYSLNVNLRFGCDPLTVDPTTNCIGRDLNNGYEQVFLSTASRVINVPEPSALALLAAGLLAVGATVGRSTRRK